MSDSTAPRWRKIAPTRGQAVLIALLFGLALLRFASAIVSATHLFQGDFAATLPGAYAEQWNLKLWDSPDLAAGVMFHRHGYGYGPTQYLTLWPIVFLRSYREIAMVLLPLYAALVVALGYLMWRVCDALVPEDDGCRWGRQMTAFASVLMFGPLLIALGQREFEMVQALVIVIAAYCVARDRPVAAGALLGYITLFKYWVVGLLGYFFVKRRWPAVAAFVGVMAAVVVIAHMTFDLGRFPFATGSGIDRQFGRVYKPLDQTQPFCADITGTAASVQTGVCAIAGGHDLAAEVVFYALLAVAGGLFLALFVLLERRGPFTYDTDERWRRVLEFCFFLIAAGVVFHAHYYYLSILVLPMTIVLYHCIWAPAHASPAKLVIALVGYTALSAFVLPMSLLSRLIGGDPWSFYLAHGIYLYGDAILAGLLFWEYGLLLSRDVRRQRPAVSLEALS